MYAHQACILICDSPSRDAHLLLKNKRVLCRQAEYNTCAVNVFHI